MTAELIHHPAEEHGSSHEHHTRESGILPEESTLVDLAEFFKVFGDVTRLRILYALLDTELCVGDLSQRLGLSQTACSHQLRVLKNNKLVRFRREGKVVYYSLSDDHVRSIIETGLEHVTE